MKRMKVDEAQHTEGVNGNCARVWVRVEGGVTTQGMNFGRAHAEQGPKMAPKSSFVEMLFQQESAGCIYNPEKARGE